MQAEIISIGEELLIGQTTNTNASWLAGELNAAGIGVSRVTAIGDEPDEIVEILDEASQRVKVVLVTGGLGPTRDDVTKTAIGRFFETEMAINNMVLSDIALFFRARGLDLTETNRQQALVPKNAKILRNAFGTAPGLWLERNKKIFVFMPGVPHEMKSMVSTHLIPKLKKRFKGQHIIHKTILTHGIGESFLSEMISDWENRLPPSIQLAYLPSPGVVKLRLSGRGEDKAILSREILQQVEKLQALIPQYIWGHDDQRLEELLGALLKKKKKTLVLAESCTGGYIAHRITSIAGSSAYFKGSVVTYSNELKEMLLGIDPALIAAHGAVSQEVAEQMAKAARIKLQADYAAAVTGIAGPSGGTPGKPVGTVWIAVAGEKNLKSKRFQFGDTRDRNIIRAGTAALGMLKDFLEAEPPIGRPESFS